MKRVTSSMILPGKFKRAIALIEVLAALSILGLAATLFLNLVLGAETQFAATRDRAAANALGVSLLHQAETDWPDIAPSGHSGPIDWTLSCTPSQEIQRVLTVQCQVALKSLVSNQDFGALSLTFVRPQRDLALQAP